MKIGVAVLFLTGLSAIVSGQDKPSANQALAPSVGLEVGHEAPTFALPDQFGHQHTNETLKGPKGAVILFFRSADW
jgi:cytochrome oxidase Cu insertion factor (SCO1/SenC/PrrC family)